MAEEVLKPSRDHAIARTAMNMQDTTLKVSANSFWVEAMRRNRLQIRIL
jgi:hypothetical protein